jgi:hypothetical protein
MKHLTLRNKIAIGLTVLCGDVAKVWAADAAREDNSGLFVWIFLAFCALIVVAQLIPAIMMLLGVAKGVKKETLQATPEMADQHNTPKV